MHYFINHTQEYQTHKICY